MRWSSHNGLISKEIEEPETYITSVFNAQMDGGDGREGVHGEQPRPGRSVRLKSSAGGCGQLPASTGELANRSMNFSSSKIDVPNFSAAASFEPGDSPTTT